MSKIKVAVCEDMESIRKLMPDTSIIILTVYDGDNFIFEAFESGAVDYRIR